MCVFYIKNISRFSANICTMQHRGEIIKAAVYRSGFPITELAKRLGKCRRWIYLMFENNSVSLDLVLQIGKIIHYDFASDIKELGINPKTSDHSILKIENEQESVEYWKNKYLKLLEEYNDLLKNRN